MPEPTTWYFDYISPYAYLQAVLLEREPLSVPLQPQAVLFAGLLNHHGHKGPAEIPSKRIHTYRHVRWLARQHDIDLRGPRAHPFNPLPLLRATVVCNHDPAFILDAFRYVWVEGHLPQDDAVEGLFGRHGVDRHELDDPAIKATVRSQTDHAIERGVFGVPTIEIEGELFWGVDTLDMARARIADPDWFNDPQMKAVEQLPAAAHRR